MKGQTVTAAFEPCQAWSGYDSTWWKSQTRQIHWLVKKLPRLGAGWNPIPIHLKSPSDHDRRLPRNQRCHPLGYTFCDQPVPTWTISPRGHASHLEPWQVMMLKVQGQFRARPHGQVSEKKCTSWKEGNDAIKFQRISFFRFWTSFYYELCTFIGMEFPIYIYIYISILHFACPTKILWWCQPCKDAWVHYSFAEPGRQECWWKWTTFWHFCHLRYIFCCFIFTFGWFPIGIHLFSPGFFVWRSMTRWKWFRWILRKTFWMTFHAQRSPRDSPDRWLWLSPAWIASSYTSGPPRMGPTWGWYLGGERW